MLHNISSRVELDVIEALDAIAATRRWSRAKLIAATLEQLAAQHDADAAPRTEVR